MTFYNFLWWCQFIDQFKFETRPSTLHNSKMANMGYPRLQATKTTRGSRTAHYVLDEITVNSLRLRPYCRSLRENKSNDCNVNFLYCNCQ